MSDDDFPDEIQVWRSTATLEYCGTWSTTRYPKDAVTYRRVLPAASAEDVRAGAHQAGMILGLQMAADIASAHDYTIQSASAADLRAVQICNAILGMIPEAKP